MDTVPKSKTSLSCWDVSQGHGISVNCPIETHTCLTAHCQIFFFNFKEKCWVGVFFYCALTICYWDVHIFVNIVCANMKLLPCISVFHKLFCFHFYLSFLYVHLPFPLSKLHSSHLHCSSRQWSSGSCHLCRLAICLPHGVFLWAWELYWFTS